MKIKKKVRFKVSLAEKELMTIRAALDFAVSNDNRTTESDITIMTNILKKLRFER